MTVCFLFDKNVPRRMLNETGSLLTITPLKVHTKKVIIRQLTYYYFVSIKLHKGVGRVPSDTPVSFVRVSLLGYSLNLERGVKVFQCQNYLSLLKPLSNSLRNNCCIVHNYYLGDFSRH